MISESGGDNGVLIGVAGKGGVSTGGAGAAATSRRLAPERLRDDPERLFDELRLEEPDMLLEEPDRLLEEPEAFREEPDGLLDEPDKLLDEPDRLREDLLVERFLEERRRESDLDCDCERLFETEALAPSRRTEKFVRPANT